MDSQHNHISWPIKRIAICLLQLLWKRKSNDKSFLIVVPYFPVDNTRVIYTKKYIKRKKPMVRVMQLKSKKIQIIYIPMNTII
jgi:hypothetical protein